MKSRQTLSIVLACLALALIPVGGLLVGKPLDSITPLNILTVALASISLALNLALIVRRHRH